MAIINPSYEDFRDWQERALDYKEIRSVYDVLRAASFYYKMAVKSPNLTEITEAISYGLVTDAWHDDSKIYFKVSKGSCIKDNQVILFQEDFQFEYDPPQHPTTYYVYVRYKFIPERPDQIAEIVIQTQLATFQEEIEFMLIAIVNVDPTQFNSDQQSGIVVDLTPRSNILTDAHHFLATNIQGGQENTIVYQVSEDTTGFITPPTPGNTLYLEWDGNTFRWVGGVFSASNIIGGAANQIPYQIDTDQTGFIDAPSNPFQYLEWNGSNFVWKSSVELSKAIEGGGSSQIVYQIAPNSTAFIDAPTETNSFLKWNGNAFEWSVITRVDEATLADRAIDIQGGSSYQILYQSAPNNTDFIESPNTTDVRYLSWDGSSFKWVASIPIAQDLLGGYANQIVYQKGENDTDFITAPAAANTYLKWDGTAFVWDSITYAEQAGAIAGGNSNQIPYQTATDSTSFIAAPSVNNTYLKWDGSSFVWDFVIASDLAGGSSYQIPFQANTNDTQFIAAPPSGTSAYLKWDGNSNFVWESAVGSVQVAECANNLTGGAQWKIPYQTGPNATTFAAAPVSDNSYLKWDSVNGFSWDTSINLAVCSCYIKGGAANQIPYQTAPDNTSFIPAPTVNDTVLSWDSTNGFKWVTGGGTGGTATDIAGGAANQILYQRATDDTDFIAAPPTSNDAYLKWDSTNGQFVWEGSVGTVQVAECANNLTGGQALDIPYQSGTDSTTFLNVGANPFVSYPVLIHDKLNSQLKWAGTESLNNVSNSAYDFTIDVTDSAITGTTVYADNRNSKGTTSDLTPSLAADSSTLDINQFLSDNTSSVFAINGSNINTAGIKLATNTAYGLAVASCSGYGIISKSIECVAIGGSSYHSTGVSGYTYKGFSGGYFRSYTNLSDTSYTDQEIAIQNGYSSLFACAYGNLPAITGKSDNFISIVGYQSNNNYPAIHGANVVTNASTEAAIRSSAGVSASTCCGPAFYAYPISNDTTYGMLIYHNGHTYKRHPLAVCANGAQTAVCVETNITPETVGIKHLNYYGSALSVSACVCATSLSINTIDSGTETGLYTSNIFVSDSRKRRNIYVYSSSTDVSYSLATNFGNTYYFDCASIVAAGAATKTIPGVAACAGNAMAAGLFATCNANGTALYATTYYCKAIYTYARSCEGIYGCAGTCKGVVGQSDYYGVYGCAYDYSVAGNTAYTETSDADYKYLCNICVQECLRARPLKAYRYVWDDANTCSFHEFIGPTVQEIEETFDMYYEERELEYDIDNIIQQEISKINKPMTPSKYTSDWKLNIDQYSVSEIKSFEEYEQALQSYINTVTEIEKRVRNNYANKPKRYIKQMYTVDGIALALANENFQCIVGFEQKFEEMQAKIEKLEAKIRELEGGVQDGTSKADTSQ